MAILSGFADFRWFVRFLTLKIPWLKSTEETSCCYVWIDDLTLICLSKMSLASSFWDGNIIVTVGKVMSHFWNSMWFLSSWEPPVWQSVWADANWHLLCFMRFHVYLSAISVLVHQHLYQTWASHVGRHKGTCEHVCTCVIYVFVSCLHSSKIGWFLPPCISMSKSTTLGSCPTYLLGHQEGPLPQHPSPSRGCIPHNPPNQCPVWL